MADTTHQVDRLKEQIDAGAHETKSYLDTLKKNVQEYDEKHPNAQKATEYLCAGIDKAQASVEELMRVGKKLSEKSKDTSDKSMELAKSSLSNVKASLDAIQHTAHEYDAKFLNSSGSSAVESVESVVNSARQRSTDVIEMASEQLTRMKDSMQNAASSAASSAGHGVQVAAGEAVLVGEKIDEKLGASEKASSAAGKVAETVMNLDKRMHVTETAAMIDSKVTGGLGASVVHKGVEMVQESITYLTDTLQQAKIAATKSGTAQAVDEKATSAIDSVSATAGSAKDTVMSAKESVVGSSPVEEMKQGASDATTMASEKAGTAKEGVKQKATEAKEGAQEMAGSAQEKASQTSGSMKEGAQEMAGNMQAKGAHGKGSMEQGVHGAEETAAEKAGAAQEGARSMAGTAQQRGGEAKQAVEQTAHGAVEKAKDVGTGAKEAATGMASGESATDERRKQAQQGGEGESGTEKVKDKAADTMSQSKSVMKGSTKTS